MLLFAQEKCVLLDQWCGASAAQECSKVSLCQLVLVEYFKNALPDSLVMFLNKHKVTTLAKAAIFTDFASFRSYKVSRPARPDGGYIASEKTKRPQSPPLNAHECFYCHKKGHVIADCFSLRRKNQLQPNAQPKTVSLIETTSPPDT